MAASRSLRLPGAWAGAVLRLLPAGCGGPEQPGSGTGGGSGGESPDIGCAWLHQEGLSSDEREAAAVTSRSHFSPVGRSSFSSAATAALVPGPPKPGSNFSP